ncbi:MAG: [FeFe] hydrogenase H-cluster maturation GTPase HydF [Spirochaetales bacterium]|nr:[FeFe] hydrogenase H-cluster maturation GTPase HydF [Spirochaetales bacterium]
MSLAKHQRPHVGIFGCRNVGKSSLINIISGQDIAIVDSYAGTTTDPVAKTFELTGLGPIVLIDTAGIDDRGDVGVKRVAASYKKISEIDLAVLVLINNTWSDYEEALLVEFEKFNLPFFIIHNKSDIQPISEEFQAFLKSRVRCDILEFSAVTSHRLNNLSLLVDLLKKNMPDSVFNNPTLLGDLVSYGSNVLLITPIDVQAPAGRLILPQVQAIRDCLDNDCITTVIKEREIETYKAMNYPTPDLVVTDSQEFLKVDAAFDKSIPLTSFSILLARFKGPFEKYLEGTRKIESLEDGDSILVLESCSHHVAGDDIGRVKIPRWLRSYTGKELSIEVVAGLNSPPRPLSEYSLVIQCGGCMLTRKQLINRLQPAIDAGVPVSNYGLVIAYCLGIFNRAVSVFGHHDDSVNYL